MVFSIDFRELLWYNYPYRNELTIVVTPLFSPLDQQHKEYYMHEQTLPYFSDFQLLRLTNPVQYYRADTQQQMLDAQKFHGTDAYYDLMENGGGFFTVDEE